MANRLMLMVLLGGTLSLANAGNHPRIGRDVNTTTSSSESVLVKYNASPSSGSMLTAKAIGAVVSGSLSNVMNSVGYSIPGNLIPALVAADSNIVYVMLDHPLQVAGSWNGSLPDFGWRTVGADQATSVFGMTGTGVGVAVIDSGMDNLDDLKDANGHSRIVYSQSFVPGDLSTSDEFGHGDHVAGILGGTGKDSTGSNSTYTVRGIAPGVNLINLKVLNGQGQGSDSAVIAAIATAIALKPVYNIRVINLSLGRPVTDFCANDLLCQAVQAAWQDGIVVVAAAGNGGRDNTFGTQGYATITAPGNNASIITVGATNTMATLTETDDSIASYSSKGPTLFDHFVKPDLVAPGNQIFSLRTPGSYLDSNYSADAVPVSAYEKTNSSASGAYFVLSGTSMAAPAVSGAVALLVEQNPSLAPDQVKAILMATANKLPATTYSITAPQTGQVFTEQNDIFTVGAGYLDIPAALADKATVGSPAVSPTAVQGSGSVTLSFPVASSTSGWGSGQWAANDVWGSGTVSSTGLLWGSSAIWGQPAGSNPLWGSAAIWGSSVLWTSSTLDAENVLWGSRGGGHGGQGDGR